MCSCDMDDGYSWDFRQSYSRKARKPHKCHECDSIIRPGERYVHNAGKWDHGDITTWSDCSACDAWGDAFAAEQRRVCGCSGWELGQLWDAIAEHGREHGWGGPSLEEQRAAEWRGRNRSVAMASADRVSP